MTKVWLNIVRSSCHVVVVGRGVHVVVVASLVYGAHTGMRVCKFFGGIKL